MRTNAFLRSMGLTVRPNVDWQAVSDEAIVLKLWRRDARSLNGATQRIQCLSRPEERPTTRVRGPCWDRRLQALQVLAERSKAGFAVIGDQKGDDAGPVTIVNVSTKGVHRIIDIGQGAGRNWWVVIDTRFIDPSVVRRLG